MILDEIMAYKRVELERRKQIRSIAELRARAAERSPPLDLAAALRGPRVGLIAEIKRASPSKGVFSHNLDAVALAMTYMENGAAAISVLTDVKFFQGKLDYLTDISSRISYSSSQAQTAVDTDRRLPLLRKDFIWDPYQVYESRAYGADALLLIAAVLADDVLGALLALTDDLGMTALVEVHNELEIERVLPFRPRLVGINNRNLKDFSVDLSTFGRLRSCLSDTAVVVAESGIQTAADVELLAEMGADAVLVGEALVTAHDTATKVRELAGVARSKGKQQQQRAAG